MHKIYFLKLVFWESYLNYMQKLQTINTRLKNVLRHDVTITRLRNDLYSVGWGVKLYSLTHSPDHSRTNSIADCNLK